MMADVCHSGTREVETGDNLAWAMGVRPYHKGLWLASPVYGDPVPLMTRGP